MYPHGVNVLNETDGDELVFRVADNFQFQLFPAQHGFLDEHLAN